MKILTSQQYKEYQDLKEWAKREKVWESANSVTKLKDDIDLPIRKCVAMFALMQFEPVFSCCGFDYHGQMYHKSHQYGEPYFMFRTNSYNNIWLDGAKEHKGQFGYGWVIAPHVKGYTILVLKVQGNPHWRKEDCIHFAEEINIAIAHLESFILRNYSSVFLEEVMLQDTNQNYKKSGIRFWQYPAKEPWHIKKSLLETY